MSAAPCKLSQLDLGGILIRPGPRRDGRQDRRPSQAAPPSKVPQVRGFTKRAGGGADWSDDIIDLAPLGLADADLALSADRLLYKDMKTGPVRLALQLKDSVAKMTLQEMLLYDGRGRGLVTLDGSGQAPATTVNLMLEGDRRAAAAQGCPGLRLARGAEHHRRRACRAGRLRAADRRAP